MTDWKPPLLGNKQPRPYPKGGAEWFLNEVRDPAKRPRDSDRPTQVAEAPKSEPPPPPPEEPETGNDTPRRRRK